MSQKPGPSSVNATTTKDKTTSEEDVFMDEIGHNDSRNLVNPKSLLQKRKLPLIDKVNDFTPTNKKFEPFANENDTYSSTGLRLTLHGDIYQLKLLLLFLKRGLKHGYSFRLATEMDEAEKFDDLVLKYKGSQQNKICRFLQAKHKQDETKTITYTDLMTDDGDFSLAKYFISYRKIKQKVKIKESDLFEYELKDFIICTNINFDFFELNGITTEEIKGSDRITVQKMNELDDFLQIDDSENIPVRYKLKVNDKQIFNKLKETSDLCMLAKELAVRVYKDENIQRRGIFNTYHIALKEDKVLDVKGRKFHDDFIQRNSSLPNNTKIFRDKFFKEFRKLKNDKNLSDVDLWNELSKQKLKISTDFGRKIEDILLTKISGKLNLIKQLAENVLNDKNFSKNVTFETYHVALKEEQVINVEIGQFHEKFINDQVPNIKKFREDFFEAYKKLKADKNLSDNDLWKEIKNKKLKLFNNFGFKEELQLHLPNEDNIQDQEIKEFFEDKLVFAVNQPNEETLGRIIANEIGQEFNLLDPSLVTNTFQKEVLDWMKSKVGKYLDNADVSNFFHEGRTKVEKLVLIGPTSEYCKKLREPEVQFINQVSLTLMNFLKGNTKKIFNLISNQSSTKLIAIKVEKALRDIEKYQKEDSFIFVRLRGDVSKVRTFWGCRGTRQTDDGL